MALEIERKAFINNKGEIDQKLNKISKPLLEKIKKDIYFCQKEKKDNIDVRKDVLFRLRDDKEKLIVTYKKRKWEGDSEVNEECEYEIDSKENFLSFVDYIGFTELIKKEKHSKVYEYKNAKIELNHIINLGDFIEVEIIEENMQNKNKALSTLNEVFDMLSIPASNITTKIYIELLIEKKLTNMQ